jgi:hypothetical protein
LTVLRATPTSETVISKATAATEQAGASFITKIFRVPAQCRLPYAPQLTGSWARPRVRLPRHRRACVRKTRYRCVFRTQSWSRWPGGRARPAQGRDSAANRASSVRSTAAVEHASPQVRQRARGVRQPAPPVVQAKERVLYHVLGGRPRNKYSAVPQRLPAADTMRLLIEANAGRAPAPQQPQDVNGLVGSPPPGREVDTDRRGLTGQRPHAHRQQAHPAAG